MDKPTFDRSRPLSWSAISSFEYDKEQWYRKYVLHEKEGPNREMMFGSKVGKQIEKNPDYLPMIARQSRMEHKFQVVFDGIPLIGYADSFDDYNFTKLEEYKTGKKLWTQKRADEHGQIDMYLLMNLITNQIRPEDVECTIHWMPTQENGDFTISFVEPIENNIRHYTTKRTTAQVLKFAQRLKRVYQEMIDYCEHHA